jgi:hypothetical protein
MNKPRFRTLFLLTSIAGLGALGPMASADPVDVDIEPASVCVVDTGSDNTCDVPVGAASVEVDAAGNCVGVLVVCRP